MDSPTTNSTQEPGDDDPVLLKLLGLTAGSALGASVVLFVLYGLIDSVPTTIGNIAGILFVTGVLAAFVGLFYSQVLDARGNDRQTQ